MDRLVKDAHANPATNSLIISVCEGDSACGAISKSRHGDEGMTHSSAAVLQ